MAVPWEGLFKYPQAGKEGSLPFRFENFGTFAGPQFDSLNYDYEINSKGECKQKINKRTSDIAKEIL